MCFIEYIGYSCGHSSIHVHRPCPLTTHYAGNPVCPQPAERPTQCHANCPPCSRILHVRWVEIVTIEHQWMHERGVCGCDVVFPSLQQPRFVSEVTISRGEGTKDSSTSDGSWSLPPRGRSDDHDCAHGRGDAFYGHGRNTVAEYGAPGNNITFEQTDHFQMGLTTRHYKTQQQPSLAESSQSVPPKNPYTKAKNWKARCQRKKKAKAKADLNTAMNPIIKSESADTNGSSNPSKPHALAWNSSISPLLQITESAEPGSSAAQAPTTVAIRLSSQYGAEWIPEHAALHFAGKCRCPVVFETYKPYKVTVDDMAEYADPDSKIEALIKQPRKPSLRDTDLVVWKKNTLAPANQQIRGPVHLEDYGFTSIVEAEAFHAADVAPSEERPSKALAVHNQAPPAPCIVASRAVGQVQIHTAGETSSTEYPLLKYDYTGTQGLPDGTAAQPSPHGPFNLQPVKPTWHQQHDVPLVGWPLGAGPEGGMENSHSPAWNMCTLSRPTPERTQSCSGTRRAVLDIDLHGR